MASKGSREKQSHSYKNKELGNADPKQGPVQSLLNLFGQLFVISVPTVKKHLGFMQTQECSSQEEKTAQRQKGGGGAQCLRGCMGQFCGGNDHRQPVAKDTCASAYHAAQGNKEQKTRQLIAVFFLNFVLFLYRIFILILS